MDIVCTPVTMNFRQVDVNSSYNEGGGSKYLLMQHLNAFQNYIYK